MLVTKSLGCTTYQVLHASSREDGLEEIYRMALRDGWRAPRWWQFWRWLETHGPELDVALGHAELRARELIAAHRAGAGQ
jgi:hypothetical protein